MAETLMETSTLRSPKEEKSISRNESDSEIPVEKRSYGFSVSPLRVLSHQQQKSISSPESKIPEERLPPPTATQRSYGGVSPIRSPRQEKKPIEPPMEPQLVHVNPLSPVIVVNRSVREEVAVLTKVDPIGDGFSSGSLGGIVEDGFDRRSTKAISSILLRERREIMVKRAAIGFRVCAVVFCLISFSVMVADKTQGWAGDSFDRYKEYRYCVSVTVIGFVYSGFQAYDLAYHLVTQKHIIQHHLRYYFDFFMDQILTYLLISASSSAATRVDDWQTNWGKDKFTEKASASVAMSFLAFTAFASSSLISGYNLCTQNP